MSQANLTHRQLEVFGLIIIGKSNAEIAAELNIAESSVKFHVGRIMRLLKCQSRANIIAGHYLGSLPSVIRVPKGYKLVRSQLLGEPK